MIIINAVFVYMINLLTKALLHGKIKYKLKEMIIMKMQYKGMTFQKKENGTFIVSSDNGKFKDECQSFEDATMWLYNMADNKDIGNAFISRICKKVGSNVHGEKIEIEEKLRKELGDRYRLWHKKEVEMIVEKGIDEDTAIKAYVKRLNKGVK